MSSVNSSEGVRSRARTRRTRVSSRSASWASTTWPRRLLRSSKRRRLRGLPPANPSVPEQATELVTEQHRYLYRRSECFRIMAVPSPAPTGPPIPYWPSVVVKPDTVRGIQTYYVTLILDIIFGVFALIVGLSSILIVTSNSASAIGAAAITGSAVCGLVIVFVINFIVSLMAVIRMHHGADEYGPEHAANARRGVLFKWIGTTLSTLAAILVVYLLLAGGSVFLFGGPAPAILYVPLLVTVFWTAGVSSKGQMYRFMMRSLQPPETRRWSDIASILIPALGVIGIAVVGSVTVRILSIISNPSSPVGQGEASRLFSLLVGGVFLPPGFALVGYVMFFWIVGKTKERVSAGLTHLYAAVPGPSAWGYPMPPPGAASPSAAPVAANPPTQSPPDATAPADSMTITCARCGFSSSSTATFCANCGSPLSS